MDWRNREQRRRKVHEPGNAHELTFTCYRRFQFLKAERTCSWLADAIIEARAQHNFDLWAYVFMPEHVHLLINPRGADYQEGKSRTSIKAPFGRRAIDYLRVHAPQWIPKISRERGGKVERLFWQSGGGFDAIVDSGEALLAMIDYFHANPVRRGLVQRPEDWKWSSAAWFAGGESPLPLDPIPWDWLVDIKQKRWPRCAV